MAKDCSLLVWTRWPLVVLAGNLSLFAATKWQSYKDSFSYEWNADKVNVE